MIKIIIKLKLPPYNFLFIINLIIYELDKLIYYL